MSLLGLVEMAAARRLDVLSELHREKTDCYRLFHGDAEGFPGLSIDRMGPLLVLQTWSSPLEPGELTELTRLLSNVLGETLRPCWNHLSPPVDLKRWHQPELPERCIGRELGARYVLRPRGRNHRPRLETVLRPARRWLSRSANGQSVIDLFARGGSLGRTAAIHGAAEVWYVDRDPEALRWNKACNQLDPYRSRPGRWLESECTPILRQLTGRSMHLRNHRAVAYVEIPRRSFDLVILDPPRRSEGPFGTVDQIEDPFHYLESAIHCTRPGGRILLIHRDPGLPRKKWLDQILAVGDTMNLRLDFEVLHPEADFPDPVHCPALKMAVLERD